jgi:hypothetical protein
MIIKNNEMEGNAEATMICELVPFEVTVIIS